MSIDKADRLWQKGAMQSALDAEGPPARQDAILDAAIGAFAAYGYRRTTMEDIARAAAMSRSALYLHFRNKDDIFRSLTERYLDQALTDMTEALHRPGQTAEQALYAAFVAKDGQLMELVLSTPHGAELMDAGFQASPGLVAEASARTGRVLTDWLVARGVPAGLGSAEELAQTIVAALMGVKSSARSLDDLRVKEAHLARLIGRALG
ncbi:TetR/AcrR family transcriptional regulator [Stagnihabitans tardus]|uniref:TetR family transcriptional regulator n=1 Tax=Stagnihabitans tardus TaxID=2699202 RepID=A0AAE5BXF0_9RHOB|nr:TetR/AcrR family transcriptional regulator [Stagnihabitans tardus]NBZ89929.1 TetR family transcriptional regulator [Stagnihabitans tardus]